MGDCGVATVLKSSWPHMYTPVLRAAAPCNLLMAAGSTKGLRLFFEAAATAATSLRLRIVPIFMAPFACKSREQTHKEKSEDIPIRHRKAEKGEIDDVAARDGRMQKLIAQGSNIDRTRGLRKRLQGAAFRPRPPMPFDAGMENGNEVARKKGKSAKRENKAVKPRMAAHEKSQKR
jgi:hypothetical protein